VLDAVRATGMSAFAPFDAVDRGEPSTIVTIVAIARGENPRDLMRAVEAYADALDRAAGVER
jgi:hypothetical protein